MGCGVKIGSGNIRNNSIERGIDMERESKKRAINRIRYRTLRSLRKLNRNENFDNFIKRIIGGTMAQCALSCIDTIRFAVLDAPPDIDDKGIAIRDIKKGELITVSLNGYFEIMQRKP